MPGTLIMETARGGGSPAPSSADSDATTAASFETMRSDDDDDDDAAQQQQQRFELESLVTDTAGLRLSRETTGFPRADQPEILALFRAHAAGDEEEEGKKKKKKGKNSSARKEDILTDAELVTWRLVRVFKSCSMHLHTLTTKGPSSLIARVRRQIWTRRARRLRRDNALLSGVVRALVRSRLDWIEKSNAGALTLGEGPLSRSIQSFLDKAVGRRCRVLRGGEVLPPA